MVRGKRSIKMSEHCRIRGDSHAYDRVDEMQSLFHKGNRIAGSAMSMITGTAGRSTPAVETSGMPLQGVDRQPGGGF